MNIFVEQVVKCLKNKYVFIDHLHYSSYKLFIALFFLLGLSVKVNKIKDVVF